MTVRPGDHRHRRRGRRRACGARGSRRSWDHSHQVHADRPGDLARSRKRARRPRRPCQAHTQRDHPGRGGRCRPAGSSDIGWVIDPIDGTVNLTYDLPVMSVSVAATLDGQVVAGAVVDIRHEDVFSASRAGGARRGGSPIEVSRPADLAESLVGTGFAYTPEGRAAEARYLHQVLPAARDIRCFGSAALNQQYVRVAPTWPKIAIQVDDHHRGLVLRLEQPPQGAGARAETLRPFSSPVILSRSPGGQDMRLERSRRHKNVLLWKDGHFAVAFEILTPMPLSTSVVVNVVMKWQKSCVISLNSQ